MGFERSFGHTWPSIYNDFLLDLATGLEEVHASPSQQLPATRPGLLQNTKLFKNIMFYDLK
jgi:hypothetical protein